MKSKLNRPQWFLLSKTLSRLKILSSYLEMGKRKKRLLIWRI